MSPEPILPASEGAKTKPRRRGRWRRRFLRFGLWVTAGVALLLFFSVVTVRSQRAREQLRLYLEDELSRRTQREVTLDQVGFGVLRPVLDLRGLRISGAGPADPPLLTVERLRFQASLLDLWRRNWRLQQVEALRPRITLRTGPDGRIDLPRWGGGRQGRKLDLRTLVVEEGAFILDELEIPLNLSAEDVRGRLLGDGPGALR
ncbi:MAG: hypothetical protein KDD47_07630, partial [Acidobacteria bacterium]|nr:hypothetical protein [Acidobacteriota bacterium]